MKKRQRKKIQRQRQRKEKEKIYKKMKEYRTKQKHQMEKGNSKKHGSYKVEHKGKQHKYILYKH